MRRLSFISLILLVGAAAAPQRALAQAGTPPPAQTPAPTGRRACQPRADDRVAQPVRADRPGALHRRPRDQHRRRPGALSALPGRPRRAALLRLPLLVRAARRQLHLQRAREQRRLARSGVLRRLQPRREAVGHRELPADPAVLQRGHDDALYGQRRHAGARRRGAARRPERQASLNAYVPIAPQFDLRERRDIGRVDVVATPTPKLDVTASFTTQKHGGELPWGASFGFSNDVEVPLPYESRANDFTIGTEWTNTKNMLRVAYSGSWFDNLAAHARLGQPAAPRRRVGHAGTRPHVAVAVQLRADDQLRRLHASWRTRRRSPASSPTACGATTSRCSRSRSIRRWRRLRCRAPTRMPKRTCSRRT